MSNLSKRYAKQQAAAKRKKIITAGCIAVAVFVVMVSFVIWNNNSGGDSISATDGIVATQSTGRGGENITVEAGKEVVWTITADRYLGCYGGFKANSSLGIKATTLSAGSSKTIKFTPTEKGTYTLRCIQMNMVYSVITVK
jgi:plastocyanin domain-containing protein